MMSWAVFQIHLASWLCVRAKGRELSISKEPSFENGGGFWKHRHRTNTILYPTTAHPPLTQRTASLQLFYEGHPHGQAFLSCTCLVPACCWVGLVGCWPSSEPLGEAQMGATTRSGCRGLQPQPFHQSIPRGKGYSDQRSSYCQSLFQVCLCEILLRS